MPSIRPSTCAGTPATMRAGGVPRRSGQARSHEVVVAADAAARHDDGLGRDLEVADLLAAARPAAVDAVGREDATAYARDGARGQDELVDAVAEGEGHAAARHCGADPSLEGLDEPGARAPGDVEARHRVAVAVGAAVAALGPADDGEEPVALLVQPRALLAGREVEVGLGPLARPEVLVPVELGRAHPVLRRELEAVLDAHPALLRAVDEEEPAEAPEGLAAEGLLALLVDEHDPLPAVGELSGGDESGETGTHDDDVGFHGSEHATRDRRCGAAWVGRDPRTARPAPQRALRLEAFGTTDFRDDPPRVTVPALVIHRVIQGGPHGINTSHADEFNRALLDFLRSDRRSPGSGLP